MISIHVESLTCNPVEKWQQWCKNPLTEELLPLSDQILGVDILFDREQVFHGVSYLWHQLTDRQGEVLDRDGCHQQSLTLINSLPNKTIKQNNQTKQSNKRSIHHTFQKFSRKLILLFHKNLKWLQSTYYKDVNLDTLLYHKQDTERESVNFIL